MLTVAGAINLRQAQNRSRQLRFIHDRPFDQNLLVVVAQLTWPPGKSTIWIELRSQRCVLVVRRRFEYSLLVMCEEAIGAVDILTAERHDAFGNAAQCLHQQERVLFRIWNYVECHMWRELPKRICEQRQRLPVAENLLDHWRQEGFRLTSMEYQHFVSFIEEVAQHVGADEPRPAYYQDA